MNLYWVDSLFTATFGLKPFVSSSGTEQARWYCYCCHNTRLICFCPSFAVAMMFPPPISYVISGRQKCEWYDKYLFGLIMLYIWQSWVALHCCNIVLSQKIYFVGVVWPLLYVFLISNVWNDPIMIQQLLLTSFFIKNNKTKPNTMIESFPCWDCCMWALHCCITSLFMFLHQWHYLILFISLNILLISARLESNC